jgi:formate hydrogenlyase transcriptional activator
MSDERSSAFHVVAAPSAIADGADLLRLLVDATAHTTGEAFFRALVETLARTLGAVACFVAAPGDAPGRVRTLALWSRDRFVDALEWAVAGTPCEAVLGGRACHVPRAAHARAPEHPLLGALGVESYLGVPLVAGDGRVLGVLAVLDGTPRTETGAILPVLRAFAARGAAELDRMRAERMLRASEERFRDLYEEAPIAYIYEDTESRFVSANRAATALLGLRPEEVRGTLGLSLVAPTAETQARVREAIDAIQQGKERACIELELRRRDDGRPVWVQWWSKPEPDGKYTRTMLVDITARVLAEQERNRLQQQNRYLREEIKSGWNFDEIVGGSGVLRDVLRQVAQVAPTNSTVLVLGETGTGKEVIARAIHHASGRKDEPLIKVNCAALPPGLIESELFGHERGAFTGATEKRTGRFALADGGTIFLDEIGDIPPEVQLRLLRVLQEQEFEPVGSSKTVKVDVRVIAATNRDLQGAARSGEFREDLFYRLSVFPLRLPPLRERGEDVVLLATALAERLARGLGKALAPPGAADAAALRAYSWPGNVRELRNVLERAIITSPDGRLHLDRMLPAAPSGPSPSPVAPRRTEGEVLTEHRLRQLERDNMIAALERAGWRVGGAGGAAELLDMSPSTLKSRMKALAIRRPGEA